MYGGYCWPATPNRGTVCVHEEEHAACVAPHMQVAQLITNVSIVKDRINSPSHKTTSRTTANTNTRHHNHHLSTSSTLP